jgi:hypothetical protein
VVAYGDDGVPQVFGKHGGRDLHTGIVTGTDPLAPYGDVDLRARQVRRVADFPHAGDLIVNSTLFPDGTVAAMEELIGNHGGLGGEQTDAFLFHPAGMDVPQTENSADLFAILDARRGLPVAGPEEEQVRPVPAKGVDDWALGTLGRGLRDARTWSTRALHALVFQRAAYREIARDPYMTGPALLIVVLSALVIGATSGDSLAESAITVLLRLLGWILGVLVVFGAARLLGGSGTFTATMRGAGFAQVVFLLELLAFIPAIAPLVRIITSILAFVATWIASVEAHELRGWRGIFLPLIYILVLVLSFVILADLISGAGFTIEALLREIGLLAPY